MKLPENCPLPLAPHQAGANQLKAIVAKKFPALKNYFGNKNKDLICSVYRTMHHVLTERAVRAAPLGRMYLGAPSHSWVVSAPVLMRFASPTL
jgi:hypothetical protein